MNPNNYKVYDDYLKSNKARNYATMDTTYAMYTSRMKNFFQYLQDYENDVFLLSEKMLKNSVSILEGYISWCRDEGNNNQTINNKITAISSFYMWCVKRDKIPYHPFQNKLDRLKVTDSDRRRESYFLTTEEIIRARVLMETKKFKLRDRLLWELFLDCGGRINAVQNIKLGQINSQKGIITGVKEKGGKVVDLMFFANSTKLLKEFIAELPFKDPSDYLFQTRNRHTTFSQEGIRSRIKEIGKLIGYPELYPHTLRKTAVNLLYKMGGLDVASEYANHSDSKVTKDHYVKEKTSEQQRDIITNLKRMYG